MAHKQSEYKINITYCNEPINYEAIIKMIVEWALEKQNNIKRQREDNK